MTDFRFFFSLCLLSFFCTQAQVKPEYLYNTGMPYGTLDIRTKISSVNYFYLKEGETFSYREASPGVKTNTYRDMTEWDSSPFDQGHLRHKSSGRDEFVMNYRVLKPLNYDPNFKDGYPLILMMHGGFERANCHFENCYHADWTYDPNINSPAAPTNTESELLNNDHNINLGGRQHIEARNLAGDRLPDATDLSERAFPGFVVIPQMMNDWDSLSVENAIRIILLHTQQYNINMNRVYIHGLSIGGHAVYQAIKRAPWLFAAALPMSAVNNGYIFKHEQQSKLINIPLWLFQGGEDTRPTVETTLDLAAQYRDAGATVRYTEYSDIGHAVWNRAYSEPDFFTFMLSQNKANIYAVKGNTIITAKENIYPTLMLAEGFFAYQWERNGVKTDDITNIITAKKPGDYRARFSRVGNPTESDWNRWSEIVTITQTDEEGEVVTSVEDPASNSLVVYPNPTTSDNIRIKVYESAVLDVAIFDSVGRTLYSATSRPQAGEIRRLQIPFLADGVYNIHINENGNHYNKRVVIRN
jgi:predicted esterase